MLLLDAGVWIATVAPEEPHHEEAVALVLARDLAINALDLTHYEVANVVACKRRQPREAEVLARVIERRCEGRLVSVDPDLVAATVGVARKYDISAYDAAYVAVARRHQWQLVSTDIRDLVSKGLAITPDAAV